MVTSTKLTTVSGECYVGMTRKEAAQKGVSNIFKDIDTDKNGTLSESEICDERDRECSGQSLKGKLFTAASLATSAVTVALSGATLGLSAMLGYGAAVSTAAVGVNYSINAKQEQELTDNYRKEHHIDANT
jgi:hypothetical protein